MMLTLLWIMILALLAAAGSIASYLRLVMRRLSPVAARRLFESNERRPVHSDRERVGISISALHGVCMALFAIGLTGLFFLRRPGHLWENLGSSVLITLGVIAIFLTATAFARAGKQDFILHNQTGVEIHEVYVSPVSTDDWEEDVLGKGTLPDGESVKITFNDREKHVHWDLKIVACIGVPGDSTYFSDFDFRHDPQIARA